MTISYNWLSNYLPLQLAPEKLSQILTAIGLEVESVTKFESIEGGLAGLIIGQVLECGKHPDADKLSITKVNIGQPDALQIVCGAANVAIGQKVVVASVGVTIYPTTGQPITMKKAKIRGVESQGMICAEDEIGLGNSHEGIMVLKENAVVGMAAADYFLPHTDWIFEIGLTPNRMDAMSHVGTAKDVCAWLTMHQQKAVATLPYPTAFKIDNKQGQTIQAFIENTDACKRYSGISISNITVKESPVWLQNKLLAIGQRPINNIVDITNFILHETGQPLHAFDAAKITGQKIIVKNLPANSEFTTLDGKLRKLHADDLMICNETEPMCLAGVFGGLNSGLTASTTHIFLESAWFEPVAIRKASVQHGLRTDAATRFEKGVDIGNTVAVLKRAALLVQELANGQISGDIIDVYPSPVERKTLFIKYHYLKKLSGKNYHPDMVKRILESLGFEILKDSMDELWVAPPLSKPDILLPADIVEEIMRIDGLDNVEIPETITMSPAINTLEMEETWKEKVANSLVGLGFSEILNNSITNSQFYSEGVLNHSVKMMNNLSSELDVLRPSMLETGLQTIAYNLNRQNQNLLFFEFGNTYSTVNMGAYKQTQHLSLFITGHANHAGWSTAPQKADFFYLKGVLHQVLELTGIGNYTLEQATDDAFIPFFYVHIDNKPIGIVGEVNTQKAQQFDIKQPVLFADIDWDALIKKIKNKKIAYTPVSKFPAVERDLAMVVDNSIAYQKIEAAIKNAKATKLTGIKLFDVFASEKIGLGKKSMAIRFHFLDTEKTMTDKEIDQNMSRIIQALEKEILAEIRK